MKYKIGQWKYFFIAFYLFMIYWITTFQFSSTVELAINLTLCIGLLCLVLINPIIMFDKEGVEINYAFFIKRNVICNDLIIERVFSFFCKIEANGNSYYFMMNPLQLYFAGMDPFGSRKENFINYFNPIKKRYDELSIPFIIK